MPATSILLQRFLPLALVTAVFCGCAQNRHHFSHEVMGTSFHITLYTAQTEKADSAARAAFYRLDQLNQVLSDYEDDSELSLLSASSGSGRWIPLSDDLYAVLSASQQISELSDGAFDPTVGPLTVQWRMAQHAGRLPKQKAITTLKERVGYTHIELDHAQQKARLSVPKMKLDLGGIAKGYALDEAMVVLREHGISRVLIDGGGDLLAADPPPRQQGWPVTLSHQDIKVMLANEAAATSGDSSRYVEINGIRYSHILDPATGMGMTNRCHATVFAPSGMQADALASTLCVLGPRRGLALIDSRIDCHAIMTEVRGTSTNVHIRVDQRSGFLKR